MTDVTSIAPLACLALGVAALIAPVRFAATVGLEATGPLGRSELRAVFGGVFIGIGAACLATSSAPAYWTGAGAFLGGAGAKGLSALLERGVFPAALLGFVVDIVMGCLFALGARALG